MSFSDPVGDMLARIRNAQTRGRSTVRTPGSKLRRWVLDVMAREGYIRGYDVFETEKGFTEFEIALKYFDGMPVIRELRRISRPGRRVYARVDKLPSVRQGFGIAIVSTPQGVMSDADARQRNVGGEVLCTLF